MGLPVVDPPRFRLLGPLEIIVAGAPVHLGAPRLRALLAVLLMRRNEPVPVAHLAECLWGPSSVANDRRAVQTYVTRLRQALGPGGATIETTPDGYRMRLHPDQLDVSRFEALVAEAESAPSPERTSAVLHEALELWRGPACAGIDAETLHLVDVVALAERRAVAQERWAEAELALGHHADVIAVLRRFTTEEPLRERRWALLMLALYRSGRQSEALAAFRDVSALLAEELGLDPSAELRDLHRAILSADPGLTGVGQPGPRVLVQPWLTVCCLPPDNTRLVGRDEHRALLRARLGASGVPIVVVTGSPGVGKTATAVAAAHQLRATFPDGQWFLHLRGSAAPRHPAELLAELLVFSGLDATAVPTGAGARAAALRARMADRRVLLVLDDAADAEQVEALLPGTAGSAVLVTSRNELRGLAVRHGASVTTLDLLTPDASVRLLADALGGARTTAEPAAVDELVELCARLPLALRIAAANLALHPHRTVADHVGDLSSDRRLSRLAIAGDSQAAVRGTFDLSYQGLEPGTRRAFRALGLLACADVTGEWAAAVLDVDPVDAEWLLEDLAARSLLQRMTPGRFAFHDLLRLYAAERAAAEESPADRRGAVERLMARFTRKVLDASARLYPWAVQPATASTDGVDAFADQGEALAWLDSERTNLVLTVRHGARLGITRPVWLLADALRVFLSLTGRHDDRHTLIDAGMTAASAADDPQGLAIMHHALGHLHLDRGQRNSGREQFVRAIELRDGCGRQADNAPSLNNLGLLYTDTGRLDLAVDCFTRAADLERAHGNPQGTATKLSNLANTLCASGRLEEARRCADSSAGIRAELGQDTTDPHSPHAQAACLHLLGDLDGAAAAFARSLDNSRRVGDRLTEATVLAATAALWRDQGDLDRALTDATAALALATKIDSGAAMIDALTTLGTIHLRLGSPDLAVDRLTEAWDLARDAEQHRQAIAVRTALAQAQLASGQLTPAGNHLRHALGEARRYQYRILELRAWEASAEQCLARGATAEALDAADRAAALYEQTGCRQGHDDILGFVALLRGTADARSGSGA
ncbi:SARP family transcriptional regulator [Longispora fulva]|uniref:DNA-binding SARP family transcriptional activator/Tfp pilus assembly protein PilF n=1 Tax=Longispora fulva TaxID=619741 RepID=A0A8J7GFV2_9ACTN|nr:BTAD domain-containing putative transcriptional regulator [Longispora fulva]MBG6135832.1 DNA-binding SARP family transcriptional activator/Tfp pilus assembly protein PilF [Longispora fulva]GIG55924.1 SARP family transcriptional regulator [Longispora fulva]